MSHVYNRLFMVVMYCYYSYYTSPPPKLPKLPPGPYVAYSLSPQSFFLILFSNFNFVSHIKILPFPCLFSLCPSEWDHPVFVPLCDLFHLTWCPLVPSKVPQTARFYFLFIIFLFFRPHSTVFRALWSKITLDRNQRPYGMPKIESGFSVCQACALPTI